MYWQYEQFSDSKNSSFLGQIAERLGEEILARIPLVRLCRAQGARHQQSGQYDDAHHRLKKVTRSGNSG
jgi:hypothetical protein